jgi:hypothetical protein
MTRGFHPLVKQLLDHEITLAELPPELRREGEDALRLLAAVDRAPVALPRSLDATVMATVRRHTASPVRRAWRRLTASRELQIRLRVRPWVVGGAFAAAAALALFVTLRTAPRSAALASTRPAGDSVFVRFVLYAPQAKRVAIAGSFNHWDQNAAVLVPADTRGLWTVTVSLPLGQHQYAFVVDGQWVQDPAAPAVDDGFGRRNSLVAVTARGARTL